jgi:probable HAF family extracellular repeat protein
MSFLNWLRNRTKGAARRSALTCRRYQPALERLEDRVCLSYTVTDLHTLDTWGSEPFSLNDSGQVVGLAYSEGPSHAFLWEDGVMNDLGSLSTDSSVAYDVNDYAQVVGLYVDQDFQFRPFLWQDGVMAAIDDSYGEANAINNAGQILGHKPGMHDPFVWEDGARYDLQNLVPTGTAMQLNHAEGINDYGQIVGIGSLNRQLHRFLLSDDDGIFANGGAVLTDLGTQYPYSPARINNAGQVIFGRLLYSNGTVTDIGFAGVDINDSGQVVALTGSGPGAQILLWQNGQTVQHQIIDPSGVWTVDAIVGINERGEIAGRGRIGDEVHAILLTPSSLPGLAIGDATVTEGNTGTASAIFTVSLSEPADHIVTVVYGTQMGSASAGSDYVATSGTLTFAAGETSQMIAVLVNGDRFGEANETFYMNLSSPINALIEDGQGQGTILDDEPSISISDVTKSEGKKGKSTPFTFTVTLSATYDQPVTMSFQTVNGTARTGNNDYIARTGTLTFAPGETTKTITITVKGDNRREGHETFYLDLFGLSPNLSGFTKNRGIGTILNDD